MIRRGFSRLPQKKEGVVIPRSILSVPENCCVGGGFLKGIALSPTNGFSLLIHHAFRPGERAQGSESRIAKFRLLRTTENVDKPMVVGGEGWEDFKVYSVRFSPRDERDLWVPP